MTVLRAVCLRHYLVWHGMSLFSSFRYLEQCRFEFATINDTDTVSCEKPVGADNVVIGENNSPWWKETPR